MYNLAKRQGLPKVGETPDAVSANTYYLDTYRVFRQNGVPFTSNTERNFVIGAKLYTQAVYNTDSHPHHIKGGSSLRSKAPRTTIDVNDNPGPADYDPIKITKKKPLPSNLPPPGKGKLYLCAPPHFTQVVPSIPTKLDENGYFLDDHGELYKNPADEHDTSLGPAFYNVDNNPDVGTYRYKGCEWSKRRAKRTTVDTCNTPGPGTYHIETEIGRMDPRDEFVREMARLFTYVPRSIEANEMRIRRENLPGPGKYDTNKSTLKGRKTTGIYPSPFVTAAKRFTVTESDMPSPNNYNLQNYPKRRKCSLINTPFGYEAPRKTSQIISYGPGPAAYHIKGSIQEKLNKNRNCHSATVVPFSTTADRDMRLYNKDEEFKPSAAEYLVEPLERPKRNLTCCHFRSKTSRFTNLAKSENADPASYSISETFNKNRNRTSHNTGKVPFQSRQPKCTERISKNPSPADYIGPLVLPTKYRSFSRSLRFKEDTEDIPGPGTYYIHPAYNDSVYKGSDTFNLRLKENIFRQKYRLPPNKTFDSWYKELKKKKMLACFREPEKDTIDYVGILFKGFDV